MPEHHPVCPVCGRETDPTCRPFCSKRCADIDLGRWFSGTYRIPGEKTEEEESGD
ncbi:DNA gyrase inhibitor YacG [Acetobacter sp. AN02]|uniref:DNA gyrase inhibitor YacG n=1 Tax=Acetobacter sp. AN02 TaxID=2894186 RepID=UPI002434410A|nr:DNA gyrase inhibitor YacG [Acetobacter sp. AN02]MDG6094420.1 DNA gyrase inhibitor YacG [Acetobacter sp. AN02]